MAGPAAQGFLYYLLWKYTKDNTGKNQGDFKLLKCNSRGEYPAQVNPG